MATIFLNGTAVEVPDSLFAARRQSETSAPAIDAFLGQNTALGQLFQERRDEINRSRRIQSSTRIGQLLGNAATGVESTGGILTALEQIEQNASEELNALLENEINAAVVNQRNQQQNIENQLNSDRTDVDVANSRRAALEALLLEADRKADNERADERLKFDKNSDERGRAIEGQRLSILQQNADTNAFNAQSSRLNATTNQSQVNADIKKDARIQEVIQNLIGEGFDTPPTSETQTTFDALNGGRPSSNLLSPLNFSDLPIFNGSALTNPEASRIGRSGITNNF